MKTGLSNIASKPLKELTSKGIQILNLTFIFNKAVILNYHQFKYYYYIKNNRY